MGNLFEINVAHFPFVLVNSVISSLFVFTKNSILTVNVNQQSINYKWLSRAFLYKKPIGQFLVSCEGEKISLTFPMRSLSFSVVK